MALKGNKRYVALALIKESRDGNWTTAQDVHNEVLMSNTPGLPPSLSTVRKILNDFAAAPEICVEAQDYARQKFYRAISASFTKKQVTKIRIVKK